VSSLRIAIAQGQVYIFEKDVNGKASLVMLISNNACNHSYFVQAVAAAHMMSNEIAISGELRALSIARNNGVKNV
jgi:hypothetical protein